MAIRIAMRKVRSPRKPTKGQFCSFCGKNRHEVRKVIEGPSVFICDECVSHCNDILSGEILQSAPKRWNAWKSMTDEDLLTTLPEILKSAEFVRESLQSRIDELRKREVSWAKIGEALDMSRQAAWERFA